MSVGERDEGLMREALRLARRGRGRTSPNPMVGAVVAKRGRIVGRGYHRRAGAPHAEVVALADAGAAARGAELFVNLEPCSHQGRTPPCTQAIVAAGIKRVVIGALDPNPLVDGVEALRRAGIEVVTGVQRERCEELNAAFCKHIVTGIPLVTLKSAITLDGRVATREGHARWVTGAASRREGHRLRAASDAIVVGVGTVLADDPQLDCREVRGKDPIRVVVDSKLRTPPAARVVQLARRSRAATWVVTSRRAAAARARSLEAAGAEVIRVASRRGQIDVRALLAALGARGVVSALLEGGPTLAGAFWSQRAVDRLVAFIAPKLLGDPLALPMLRGGPVLTMDGAHALDGVRWRRVAEDLMISGVVRWPRGKEA